MYKKQFNNPMYPLDPDDSHDEGPRFIIFYIVTIAAIIWAIGHYKFNVW